MARTIFAGEALGYQRMRASAKKEVIQYLGAADVPGPMRRRWYREWCKATFTKLRLEDLQRVAPLKLQEQQLGLLVESPGRGEPLREPDTPSSRRKAGRSSSAKSRAGEIATGACTPATASTSGE